MEWVRLMVKNFSFPHINVLFPTAPLQPYTPSGGLMSNVWFDRTDVSPEVPEKMDSLASIEKEVTNLIHKENQAGIPSNRIIVGWCKTILLKRKHSFHNKYSRHFDNFW
jgi:phospholipase/carboxylesterase